MDSKSTVVTQDQGFTIRRLTKAETTVVTTAGVQQTLEVNVTFVYGGLTGNSKVVNGQTWYEAYGTYSYDNPSVTITYGNTAKIKIKTNHNASTNGWKIVTFNPKPGNPSGGPGTASADGNGDVTFDDNNTVAGTYAYSLYLECASSKYYSSSDPTIIQTGGGDGVS